MSEMIVQKRIPKNNTPPVVNKAEEDKLLEYVNTQIEKFRKYSNLGNTEIGPGFYELTEALRNWPDVNYSLIGMNVLAKREYQQAKNEFDDFMAEKYMEQRSILNPPGMSATKYAGSKEIEYAVRNNYRDEYKRLSDNMNDAEMKIAFIRRLQESWEKNLLVLNRLCKNVDTETIKLGSDIVNPNF